MRRSSWRSATRWASAQAVSAYFVSGLRCGPAVVHGLQGQARPVGWRGHHGQGPQLGRQQLASRGGGQLAVDFPGAHGGADAVEGQAEPGHALGKPLGQQGQGLVAGGGAVEKALEAVGVGWG
jgi:hypothetical protein